MLQGIVSAVQPVRVLGCEALSGARRLELVHGRSLPTRLETRPMVLGATKEEKVEKKNYSSIVVRNDAVKSYVALDHEEARWQQSENGIKSTGAQISASAEQIISGSGAVSD